MNLLNFFNFLNAAKENIFGYNSFFYVRNIIEIFFITTLIYYFSIWLKKDTKKNLLLYFYSYCFFTLASYYFQLPTMSYLLFLFAPVGLVIFILIHQTTLQKNFITLNNTNQIIESKNNWPQKLIRSILFAINNNKSIFCVIEKYNNLQDFLIPQITINSDIEDNLLNMLQTSTNFDQNKLLWIKQEGKLYGINTEWNSQTLENIILESESINKLSQDAQIKQFKQMASIISTKTDAIFFYITPTERTFTIIFSGEIFNNINSDNIVNIITKHTTARKTSTGVKLAPESNILNNNSKNFSKTKEFNKK